jgi:hypothetical protein
MELRYLGFEQSQNARAYRFDVIAKGEATRHCIVTVDLALFRTHRVGIQEGPSLCAHKLLRDLGASSEGAHELTTEDLRVYAEGRAMEEARRVEARKSGSHRSKTPPDTSQLPWRKMPV